jgi:hypothetical protein
MPESPDFDAPPIVRKKLSLAETVDFIRRRLEQTPEDEGEETPLMPESPDFEQLAQSIASEAGFTGRGALTSMIAEQLRLVWNARGAADLAAFRAIGNSSPQDIVRALRTLDR